MMFEKRRYERVSWFCPVDLKALPNGPTMKGNTFDISVGGVGIATNLMLERGRSVLIRFHMHDNVSQKPFEDEIMGRVAYSRADEDGDRIGIEFLEVVNEMNHPELAKQIEHLSSVAC